MIVFGIGVRGRCRSGEGGEMWECVVVSGMG